MKLRPNIEDQQTAADKREQQCDDPQKLFDEVNVTNEIGKSMDRRDLKVSSDVLHCEGETTLSFTLTRDLILIS
jgi:hypothetical protein